MDLTITIRFMENNQNRYSINIRGVKECSLEIGYTQLRDIKQYLKSHECIVGKKFPKVMLWKQTLTESQLSMLEQVSQRFDRLMPD